MRGFFCGQGGIHKTRPCRCGWLALTNWDGRGNPAKKHALRRFRACHTWRQKTRPCRRTSKTVAPVRRSTGSFDEHVLEHQFDNLLLIDPQRVAAISAMEITVFSGFYILGSTGKGDTKGTAMSADLQDRATRATVRRALDWGQFAVKALRVKGRSLTLFGPTWLETGVSSGRFFVRRAAACQRHVLGGDHFAG
jgi:hypothetical protein